MRFRDIEHQERALSILRRALRSGRTHHAYLLEGPSGVGKETAARALAARLLCLDERLEPDADGCGRCDSCRILASGNHPDLHVIDRRLRRHHPDRAVRAGKGLFLVVALVRHFLIEPSSHSPALGRRRVFIVREAETMNDEAQNALLKTLEEPPGDACLILITDAATRLLPTILSRCQRVPFDRLPDAFVRQRLEQARIPPAQAASLAVLAQGRLGDALHGQRIGLVESLHEIDALLAEGAAARPEAFGKRCLEIATNLAGRIQALADDEAAEEADASEPDAQDLESPDERDGPEAPDERGLRRAAGRSAKAPVHVLRDALRHALGMTAALYREALLLQCAPRLCALRAARSPALLARCDADALLDAIAAVAQAELRLDRNVSPQLVCEALAAALNGALACAPAS